MCSPAAFHCSCILKPFLLHCEVAWQSISFDHFANTLPRLFFSPIEISSQAWLCDVLAKWPTLIGWSVYQQGLGCQPLFDARHQGLRTREGETATTEEKTDWSFLLPIWNISGCSGTHLISVARPETKAGMSAAVDICQRFGHRWPDVLCVKSQSDQTRVCQVGLQQVRK